MKLASRNQYNFCIQQLCCIIISKPIIKMNKDKQLLSQEKIDFVIVDENSNKFNSTFQHINKTNINLFNQDAYTDQQFKLHQIKSTRKIVVKRLRDIYPPNTPLFGKQLKDQFKLAQKDLPHKPTFLSQIKMLPIWHYKTLIQPQVINKQGFYRVVIWKDGRLTKQTIDDTLYFDETTKQVYTNNYEMQKFIWAHILIKVWAKINKGYDQMFQAKPFSFIKTFSYPDWQVINPNFQQLQKLISSLSPIQNNQQYCIVRTKSDANVGLYGLIPNCASYILTGHEQEYGDIFLKIKTLVGGKWNGKKSDLTSNLPEQQPELQSNEFIIPLKQFLNVFRLMYLTHNKFQKRGDIYYTKYSLNLDARQSKTKMLAFDVEPPKNLKDSKQAKQMEFWANLNLYFPSVRAFDLNNPRQDGENQQYVIPFCKIIFGQQNQTTNADASYVESMKQKMLQNQNGDFLASKSQIQYFWKKGCYFKGYDNQLIFLMKLKPGRYYLRFKIQTLRVQYRTTVNIVSKTQIKISDPKMDKKEQLQYLRQVLSSKARIQKRNIGYLNPIKKGSWFICNDDFKSVGYGYIVAQTRKGSDFRLELIVDPKKLKQCGYRIKDKKDQNRYNMSLEDGSGTIIILKLDQSYNKDKERTWPPLGIQLVRHWRKQDK